MQCAFLHILNFPEYIVHRFMYCFSCMYCVSIHVLFFLHVLRIDSCIVFPACIVYWFMSCACFDVLCTISIYPTLLHACQVSFWTYIWFLKIIYPKFLWLTNRYPYFPLLLDIKSLTLLVYVQFSSDSILFSPTPSLILDISCCFLMIMSNFHLAKLCFYLHCSWFWMFPAVFSWLCPISILLNYVFTCTALHFGYFLLFSHNYVQSW